MPKTIQNTFCKEFAAATPRKAPCEKSWQKVKQKSLKCHLQERMKNETNNNNKPSPTILLKIKMNNHQKNLKTYLKQIDFITEPQFKSEVFLVKSHKRKF